MKRFALGLNVGAAVVLLGILLYMGNYLSYRHGYRKNVSCYEYLSLSDKTKQLLQDLDENINIFVFVRPSNKLYSNIRDLCREYVHASHRIHVEYIDPNRDLARTKSLAFKYDVTEPDTIVFSTCDKQKMISVREIAEYENEPAVGLQSKEVKAFRGEQVFSSLIRDLTRGPQPNAYFLTGHGERLIDNYDQYSGYSIIARKLRHENIEVHSLSFGETSEIPENCNILIIAGPSRQLSRAECAILKNYLENSGRLLLLLDAGFFTGLDELLKDWGLKLADDRVISATSWTGSELVVTEYGKHQITESLGNITTIFNLPRSLQPVGSPAVSKEQHPDKPSVTVLASSSQRGWAEMTPDQNPPIFDSKVDRPGPVAVAVAIEKGHIGKMNVALKPTRLVIIGDSTLVSNGALLLGYNTDLFISAVNWLLNGRYSMDIPKHKLPKLRIVMGKSEIQASYMLFVAGIPAVIGLLGIIVWLARRK